MKSSRLLLSSSLILALSACSTFERRPRKTEAANEHAPAVKTSAGPPATASAAPTAAANDTVKMKGAPKTADGAVGSGKKDDMKLMLKTADGKLVAAGAPKGETIVNTAGEEAAAAHAAVKQATAGATAAAETTPPGAEAAPADAHKHKREVGAVSAEKSLGWLKNGNRRYVRGFLRKDGQSASDRKRLVASQSPHAIILSCSDSRVPPEIVFDQKLGELFVIRTAGENIDPAALASIEYGVEHLGANLIVVMGHTSCGAVRAALATMDGSDAGSPWLNALLAATRLRLQSFKDQTPSADLHDEVWANVSGVSGDLVQKSEIIRGAVADGSLKISQAVYDLSHGTVEFK